jgi:hypothetical protein
MIRGSYSSYLWLWVEWCMKKHSYAKLGGIVADLLYNNLNAPSLVQAQENKHFQVHYRCGEAAQDRFVFNFCHDVVQAHICHQHVPAYLAPD